MNVTDRGYYTTQYLDNVNRPRRRHNEPRTKLESKASVASLAKSHVPESPELTQNSMFPESPEGQMTNASSDDLVINPDELQQEITPAQLNILQKQHERRRHNQRKHHKHKPAPRLQPPASIDMSSNYYDEETSMSDRTYNSYDDYSSSIPDNNSSMYDNYYNRDHRLRIPKHNPRHHQHRDQHHFPSPNHKKVKNPPQNDNFYIQQKKRYDDAEFVKPKNYTHKTFRDVFEDNNEDTGRYNPIELVFDDPEKIREQEENQKFKRAMKTLQVKMGKDDYKNYDYYTNKGKETPNAAQEIFTGGADSDDSDDEADDDKKEEVYVEGEGEEEGEDHKKKKKSKHKEAKKKDFKKIWRKGMKKAKKGLGEDFLKNMEKQWEMEEEKRRIKELEMEASAKDITEEDEVTQEPTIIEPDDEEIQSRHFYAGQNPNFHPMWNYVLSWLTYDQQGANQIAGTTPYPQKQILPSTGSTNDNHEDIKSIIKSDPVPSKPKKSKSRTKKPKNTKNIKVSADQLKNFNKNLVKNYTGVKNMWTMPASNLFNGQTNQGIDGNHNHNHHHDLSNMTIDEALPQSIVDIRPDENDSQEFIIEVDEDEAESYGEELYYNPITKQLEREPPTSFLSMDSHSFGTRPTVSTGPTNRSLVNTSGGAKSIVSNINSLIKSVKIMKIIFAPIDIIGESFPSLQTLVILLELVIFMWILYELSLLIDALCMMVKALCAPMIAMGRFMNRFM